MLCLMDTLTVKDTEKQGEGQLKFSFKILLLEMPGSWSEAKFTHLEKL